MTARKIALFILLFVASLVLFMPLSFALSMAGSKGLSARSATGLIWSGKLADARVGRLNIGDLSVGLDPWALLVGRTRLSLLGLLGRGALTSTREGLAIDDATAKFGTARLFAPIPLDGIEMTDVTVHFTSGKCDKAQGRVRATFTGDVGGISLAQGLSGEARCDGGALMLPLMSQSTMERLNLRIQATGDYRADFIVRSTDPAMALKLSSAGFIATPGGLVLRLAGKL